MFQLMVLNPAHVYRGFTIEPFETTQIGYRPPSVTHEKRPRMKYARRRLSAWRVVDPEGYSRIFDTVQKAREWIDGSGWAQNPAPAGAAGAKVFSAMANPVDVTVERHPVSGAWLVSTIIDGHLVRRTYFGYTRREAERRFRAEQAGSRAMANPGRERRPFGQGAAMRAAQTNADYFGVPFCVFQDTSGNWRSDRASRAPRNVAGGVKIVQPRNANPAGRRGNPDRTDLETVAVPGLPAGWKLVRHTRHEFGTVYTPRGGRPGLTGTVSWYVLHGPGGFQAHPSYSGTFGLVVDPPGAGDWIRGPVRQAMVAWFEALYRETHRENPDGGQGMNGYARQYERLYNRTRRAMGGPFDWPTLKASIPGRAEELRRLWNLAYRESHPGFPAERNPGESYHQAHYDADSREARARFISMERGTSTDPETDRNRMYLALGRAEAHAQAARDSRRENPEGAPHDFEITELVNFAENTAALYNQEKSIVANLTQKLAKGTYNPALAPKLWRYWFDNAAKLMQKEAGWLPSTAVRQAAAEEKARNEYEKMIGGAYGELPSFKTRGGLTRGHYQGRKTNPAGRGAGAGFKMFHDADPDRAYKVRVPDSFPARLYMIGKLHKLVLANGKTITGGVLAAGSGDRMYIVGARSGPESGRAVQVEYVPPKASRKFGAVYYHKFKRPPLVRRIGAGGHYTVAGKGVKLTPRGIIG